MPETQEIKVQKALFDLKSFSEVTLVKVAPFEPVGDVATALARVGNDNSKLLSVINDGLKAEAMRELRSTSDGWHTFKKDAEGEDTNEINGPFDGQLADMKKVNSLVLTLAKSVFGFGKDMTKDQKRAAKESAEDMIKNTEAIRNGLAKSAALTVETED